MRSKTCSVRECKRPVRTGMVFCHTHWSVLDKRLQLALVSNYRKGQLGGRVHPTEKWDSLIADAQDYLEKFI